MGNILEILYLSPPQTTMLNFKTIRGRIVCGYVFVLGITIVGTKIGLTIGNHHQQHASKLRQIAATERELLSDLQVRILYNRPAKQLSPHLSDPARFEAESKALLDRVTSIQTLLHAHNRIHGDHDHAGLDPDENSRQLHQLLGEYEASLEQFRTRTQTFAEAVSTLSDSPSYEGYLETAQQMLLTLVQSPEFVEFVEFPDKLAPFIEEVDEQEQIAEAALQRAEALRNQILLSSLMISAIIATVTAVYTSQAITRPIRAVTDIAHRVTQENNFDLQASITGRDEVGTLAQSLNRLIQQVRQLLAQLNQKNTELEDALKQLGHQQMQLVQAEKMSSLGQLVAGVAHEINNPVNFIHGNLPHLQQYSQDLLNFVSLHQQHYPNPPAAIAAEADSIDLDFIQSDLPQMLHSIRYGTERIRKIVLSLRNFSRMDEAEIKTVNIHEGLESTLLMLHYRLKAKPESPTIEVIKDYGELPPVDCYAGQLNQVFMNILTNAIDALEEMRAALMEQDKACEKMDQITIRTSVVLDSQWIQIEIADNGPGIPDEVQRRIFEPFFTTKPIGKGTGIGMSISHQIITERHSGKLDIYSTPGQGTAFIIQIPIQQEAA